MEKTGFITNYVINDRSRRTHKTNYLTKILLILCISVSFASVPSFAIQNEIVPEEIIRPMFTYINVFQSYFDISPNGKSESDVFLYAYEVEQVKVEAHIQHYKNGEWQTIKSWSNIETGTSCGLGEYWYLMSGYSYRLVANGYTYINGKIVEDTQIISDTVYY